MRWSVILNQSSSLRLCLRLRPACTFSCSSVCRSLGGLNGGSRILTVSGHTRRPSRTCPLRSPPKNRSNSVLRCCLSWRVRLHFLPAVAMKLPLAVFPVSLRLSRLVLVERTNILYGACRYLRRVTRSRLRSVCQLLPAIHTRCRTSLCGNRKRHEGKLSMVSTLSFLFSALNHAFAGFSNFRAAHPVHR